MHGAVVEAVEMSMIANAGTPTVKAAYGVTSNGTGMNTGANVPSSADGSDASAAKPADMTHAASDVNTAKASDRTDAAQPTDVSPAAEAAAHTARVATAATAARLCLRSQQTRRQQGHR
jgi:hypothetical protein